MPVGQEIVCFCSSCKLELRHVVVAHKSGNSGPISKVRCNTCKKIHAFRSSPTEKSAAAAREKKVARAAAGPRKKPEIIPVEVEWQSALDVAKGKASLPYAPSGEFKAGDVIEHPTFGCGIVKSTKDGNKFEVIFQRDIKTLIHKLKEA